MKLFEGEPVKSPSEPESSELNSNVVGDVQKDASNVCPTRSIDDSPAKDDLLAPHGEIGPHERVAQAIAGLLLSPKESGGKMIGLEGGRVPGRLPSSTCSASNCRAITTLPFSVSMHGHIKATRFAELISNR